MKIITNLKLIFGFIFLMFAIIVIWVFENSQVHDLSAKLIIMYALLFLPGILLIVAWFFRQRQKTINRILTIISVISCIFSFILIGGVSWEVSLSPVNSTLKYESVLSEIKSFYDPGIVSLLPEKVPQSATNKKLLFMRPFGPGALILDLKYTLPETEYTATVEKYKKSCKRIEEQDGWIKMIVMSDKNKSKYRDMIIYYSDNNRTIRYYYSNGKF